MLETSIFTILYENYFNTIFFLNTYAYFLYYKKIYITYSFCKDISALILNPFEITPTYYIPLNDIGY